MKPKKLLIVLTVSALTFGLFSCKKSDDTATDEIETTFSMSADQATADNMTEDDNDVMMSVAEEQNLTGGFTAGPAPTTNDFICATVTVTPQNGFPKTIVIDFGTGCTSPNGVHRSGIIQVVISDSLRRPGSTAVMTFQNYYVNYFHKEGTITWTNTSTVGTRSWRREIVNGKITAPGGRWWLHNGIKDIVQTGGSNTPQHIDDIFSITGHSTVINSNGVSRTATITQALQKKVSCHWIDTGRIRFEGPNHFAILDFGNGMCDDIAIITIDGRPPHTIHLP